MTMLKFGRPEVPLRTHEILISTTKSKFGNKTTSFSLWAEKLNLLDVYKIIKLVALDKADKYLNSERKFIVKIPSQLIENRTHTIQIRGMRLQDYKTFEQDSFGFSITEPDLTAEDIKNVLCKYLTGDKEIADEDYEQLNLGCTEKSEKDGGA